MENLDIFVTNTYNKREKCRIMKGHAMRVIAGTAKRIQLKTAPGMDTRPTTDRIKETLFNMIAPGLCDCVFLDMFAGSGGIGIEALSRGAAESVFIEKDPKAISCIKDNLKNTKLQEYAEVLSGNAIDTLLRLDGRKQFDYIFMDPPYDRMLEKEVLECLKRTKLLKDDTVIIIEASKETDFSYLTELGYSLIKRKEYKTNVHVFVSQEEE